MMEAPWLLPAQKVTGLVLLSTQIRRISVLRGRDIRRRSPSPGATVGCCRCPDRQGVALSATSVQTESSERISCSRARCVEAESPKALNRAIQHMLERAG
jgi:hypothetical protein